MSITLPLSSSAGMPHPYHHSLTPQPSTLRPHCLARDRVHLWTPITSRSHTDHSGSVVAISDYGVDRIFTVLAHSHAVGTRECYGAGLLVFHMFCDSPNIPDKQCCPASSILLLAFLASCAGLYSGGTLENYFYSIRTWHLLHGLPWLIDQAQVLALEGAKWLAPRAPHDPNVRHSRSLS